MEILVVDDHALIREGVRKILASQPGWNVCAEASTGQIGLAEAMKLKPEVAIIDLSMPDMDGLQTAKKIKESCPNTEIVMLSVHFSDELVRKIMEAGIKGYVLKSDAGHELVRAVEAAANHRSYLTDQASKIVRDARDRRDIPMRPIKERLTSRQREIVRLIAEGKSSKQVAKVLGISAKTAETHRANIMRKLGIHTVSDLVHYAYQNKIVE
jgi:two-component system, NarL family, response regulator NreC